MLRLAAMGATIAVSMSLGAAHAVAYPSVGFGMGMADTELQPVQYTPEPEEDEEMDEGRSYGGGGGYGRGRISCWQGRRLVERRGFYRVRPRDCGGRNYGYSAFRRGQPWFVRVNANSGQIISARPGGGGGSGY